MALRIPLEWQALSGDLQDLEGAGSQESRIAGARAVTGRWSRTGKQKNPDVVRLLESLLQLVGIFAGGPSAEDANPWVLRVGWQLLESTSIAGMKLDHITADHALTIEGSSAANTDNALRTLRRMLKKAQEWQLLSTVPIVKLVEEQGREELIEPWMEQRLLAVTGGSRLTGKGRKSRVGWEPFRTVLLIMLDSGLRPGEIFRMRWENIHWDKGLIFNPRGKSRKSRRYVPLTERVNVALVARKEGVNEGWVFPSKRAQSGYITDREVSKQWLEAKRLAGIPESVVLYCARHRFSTDAMEGTGNVMAVMDAMGHGSVNTTRIYTHSNVQQIREAIERRNRLSTTPVEAVQ